MGEDKIMTLTIMVIESDLTETLDLQGTLETINLLLNLISQTILIELLIK